MIAYLSGLISSEATDFWWLVGLNFTALLTHLFLDLITSFGTAVFYPLSNKRYAWGTHFLADPTISILLMLSLIPVLNVWMLMLLGGYFLLSLMLRLMAKYQAQVHQDQLALTYYPLYLRPRTFAPWQWLAVIVKDDEYVFFYLSPFGFQPSQTTPRGLETRAAHHAEKDDLLRCYISIADFPRYEDTQRDGQPAIVVEDIQWWWKLPYRPMAMSALIDNKGVPYQVKESKKISTSPTG